ncbi:MDR family MFS transporter [Aestuariimicrobium ganziense]|uniref:MDR family MFS transporter n=1 Tax=Aestuariimicrobium ganziense TaxID=2773677 RepID=UPI0019411BAE|nr:MDR family MFS transporter [Aestuariimicrobium ganziense]
MQAAQTTTAPVDADAPIKWSVIGLLLVAAFTVILNETTLGVAIPHLMHDLDISARTAQWLSTGFLLTMSVVIPTTGFIMDRLTTRQVFLTAMGLFIAGTVICALAPGFEVLLGGRVVQASGTAVMMPLLMTTILNLVPMHKRGQTMGLVSICISMAPAMGPTVSGVILQVGSWRTIFWVMLPIAIIATALGFRWLTNVGQTRPTPIDPASIILSVLGFGGLVYALSLVGQPGQTLALAVCGVLAVVALALFVARQLWLQKHGQPLLDLRIFLEHNFRVSLGVMMLSFLVLMGVALIWPIYLQDVRGVDEVTTGMMLLPGGLAMGLLGPVVGRLFDRLGARPLVVPATVVMAVCILTMSRVDETTPLWMLVTMHAVLSLSLSFMFTPCFTAALNATAPRLYAHGSAGLGTLQQVAGAAGAALLITVMEATQRSQVAAGMAAPQALMNGVSHAFLLGAALSLGSLVLGLLIRRQSPTGDRPPAAAH